VDAVSADWANDAGGAATIRTMRTYAECRAIAASMTI